MTPYFLAQVSLTYHIQPQLFLDYLMLLGIFRVTVLGIKVLYVFHHYIDMPIVKNSYFLDVQPQRTDLSSQPVSFVWECGFWNLFD